MWLTILLFLVACLSLKSTTDQWPEATTAYYTSDNGEFVLKVIPGDPHTYWGRLRSPIEPKSAYTPEERDTTETPCKGSLFRITNTDSTLVWTTILVNVIAPVSAIVSNDGKWVITFDNWHGIGYGQDMMSIYNEVGNCQKMYALDEISPFPVLDYLMSVSSIYWSCGKELVDDHTLELCFDDENDNTKKRIYDLQTLKFQ